jgi:carboxymethylenebutenolidase
MGEMVQFAANGHTTSGYLALPPTDKGPGLLVIQEWWGLVDHIKRVADRFAAAGFVALAPDFYDGQTTQSPDAAAKLFMALNIDRAAADLRGAADHLLGLSAVPGPRVGTVGFCMGGQLALYAGMALPERIGAAVDFYGIHPKVAIDPTRVTVPVQGHFGSRDGSIPVDGVRDLAAKVNAAGGQFELHVYDADHAFFNDTRPTAHDAAAATLAWDRTLGFLRKHLAG